MICFRAYDTSPVFPQTEADASWPFMRHVRRALWFFGISRRDINPPQPLSIPVQIIPSNKIDELALRCRRHTPDVVIITETWADPCLPDNILNINGFDILRCDRDHDLFETRRDSYGGRVAMYIKHGIAHETVELPNTSTCKFKSNILCCRLPRLCVILFCIYHPYWGNAPEHLCPRPPSKLF